MASYNTLEYLRTQLVNDIAQSMCEPCVDARKDKYAFNHRDPLSGSCRCKAVEPFIERLEELEKAIDLTTLYLR